MRVPDSLLLGRRSGTEITCFLKQLQWGVGTSSYDYASTWLHRKTAAGITLVGSDYCSTYDSMAAELATCTSRPAIDGEKYDYFHYNDSHDEC